jgi:hypothetical protein
VDAAYTNNLRNRRSTTGYTLCLAGGGTVVYCSKTQTVTALSSTGAEFHAAVATAKVVLYIRAVLHVLGYTQKNPTSIYEDNKSAISTINSRTPTYITCCLKAAMLLRSVLEQLKSQQSTRLLFYFNLLFT